MKFLPDAAISPRVTYDFDKDVFGVDLPIYLVQNMTGALVGGIRVGYRDDNKGVILGIFAGTKFSFF